MFNDGLAAGWGKKTFDMLRSNTNKSPTNPSGGIPQERAAVLGRAGDSMSKLWKNCTISRKD